MNSIECGLPQSAINQINSVFEKYSKIEKVILYGSRAMGTYKLGSDIDLCILSKTLSLTDLLAIETQLDDLLLPWKIDLSLMNKIDNSDLLAHINTKGLVFYPS